jgi:FAD/FMN-containing dehydrogenase
MSKITQYLNEHLLGEVTSNEHVRKRFSRDGSILTITPEIVINPRVTNDIRKACRFAWQLAEKGHVMSITARGGGTDTTGAAIGKGIIISTLAHLNNIIYINEKAKDKFVHVQPGVNFKALNDTLKSHGMTVPAYPSSATYSTVGGAVANNSRGPLSGSNGPVGNWVNRLEVVLANGDLIEASRISRRELNKKKGLQTFEGEIYRKIDGIIDDNQQLLNEKITTDNSDNTGYPGIIKVKQRDGSFDLSPLFIGSQGTLGIISEIIFKTEFYNSEESIVVATFDDAEIARSAANLIAPLQPVILDYLDGRLFNRARDIYGKKYLFGGRDIGAVLFISFNDFSKHARSRKAKQVIKKLSKLSTTTYTSEKYPIDDLHAIHEISSVILESETKGESLPPLIDGAIIPPNQREEFIIALDEFAKKHHVELPLHIKWLDNVLHARPILQLHLVSDKQKAFKLISDYAELVTSYGGSLSGTSGEGRLQANASYSQIDPEILNLYTQIRSVFDPFGTLNPGVKQQNDLKTLVSQLNPDYSLSDFAAHSPKI